MAGHAGPPAVHRDGEPGVLLVRSSRPFCKWWLGAGCVKGASPVLRGGGAQSWTSGGGNLGWGASFTNTQERVGGSPAALAKNSGSTRPQLIRERPCPTHPDGVRDGLRTARPPQVISVLSRRTC